MEPKLTSWEGNSVHPSASVSPDAGVGRGTKIWQHSQVREGASIGEECILGFGVYVDVGVRIGDRCKIQNGVSLYQGVTLEDGVFVGPNAVFTNDLRPRAINQDGSLQGPEDWSITKTQVKQGASIGANATIVCGTTLGAWCMVGAGAVVTKDVPDHGLVLGNPARLKGLVCYCGHKLAHERGSGTNHLYRCPECSTGIEISDETHQALQG